MENSSKKNPKCPCCTNQTIKIGLKRNKKRILQRYRCKTCKHTFMIQPKTQKSKTYSLKTILDTISEYNLGTPLRKITNYNKLPKSTVHDWIKSINLPMNRLRNRLKQIPKHEIIIKQSFIHHKQPFLFQYHRIKLEFAKKYPYLIKYLTTINSSLPKDIFKNSKRISAVSKRISERAKESSTTWRGEAGVAPSGVPSRFAKQTVEANVVVELSKASNTISKQNYAVELAKLAASITKDNRERHNIIENFMLINDASTIAVEIPVYLSKEESPTNRILTGHIDILQLRYNRFYILDYKPCPINRQQAISQLNLYRKALSALTGINHFRLAYFNENEYCEIC